MSQSHSKQHDAASPVNPFDGIELTFVKLQKLCCDETRSPAMTDLGTALDDARDAFESAQGESAKVDEAIATMSEAASQLAILQVACCAPVRMPLYETILRDLNSAQIALNRSIDKGH